MKKFQYILLASATLALVGCDSFFETGSPSTMNKEYVFESPVRTANAIEGIYYLFGENNSYRNRLACGFQGLNTDIEHSTKSEDYSLYSMTPTSANLSNADGKDIWGYINAMVERSMGAMEGIQMYGDTTNELMRYYLGEVTFLRSFAYLELTKYWGDVPNRFESMERNPNGVKIKKNDRNLIYDQLRIDLREAARLMPWAADCPDLVKNKSTRPSRAAALALLARVDLTYAGYALRPDYIQVGGGAPYKVQLNTQDEALRKELYEEAMWACAEIIKAEGDFKFKEEFADVFKALCADEENYTKTEFIWEIPFANGTRGQFMNYNSSKLDQCVNVLKNNSTSTSNACQAIVPTFVYDFDAADKRKWVTIVPYQWYADNCGDSFSKDDAHKHDSILSGLMPQTPTEQKRLWQKPKTIENFFLGKFRVEWMTRDRNSGDEGVNFPIVRYGDVMLMFCEAAIGGITGTAVTNTTGVDAQEQFDRIRSRAGLPSKELTMAALIDERAFELCGEYIRKYDLMRWGQLTTKLLETNDRLNALVKHEGEFADTQDTIYYCYRLIEEDILHDKAAANDVTEAYEMCNIYGLAHGEVGRPALAPGFTVGVKSAMYGDHEEGKYVIGEKSSYKLFDNAETLERHQYYPIFLNNIGTSDGALWNDYDY